MWRQVLLDAYLDRLLKRYLLIHFDARDVMSMSRCQRKQCFVLVSSTWRSARAWIAQRSVDTAVMFAVAAKRRLWNLQFCSVTFSITPSILKKMFGCIVHMRDT